MAFKYDAEDLMLLMAYVMQNNGALNTQITSIETEKAARSPSQALTPGLLPIGANNYFKQSWSDKILNTNPAIFYGIEDVSAEDGGGATAKTYLCFVEIILIDNGQTNDCWQRVFRYSRALEEVFENALSATAELGKLKIKQLRPVAAKMALDTSEEIKTGGISFSVTIV